jgi:DNA repair protein RecN (Recombination protein N)
MPSAAMPTAAVLETLRIRDLGVIDDVEIEFGAGLTVVTGETGAGKTMVVTGLQLLFGGRADASRVRGTADQASIEGRLALRPGAAAIGRALDAGGAVEDGELLIRRAVTANGRSRGYVGGTAAPLSVLTAIAEDVLSVHGQSDQLRLSQPVQQRQALDAFADIDLEEYRAAFATWQEAALRLTERQRDTAARRREADLLSHGLAEIEAAAPQPGEDHDLAVLTERLGAADELLGAARRAHDVLLGDPDAPDVDTIDVAASLGRVRNDLAAASSSDPALAELAGRVVELQALVGELGADLAGYLAGIDADPARLAASQDRRAVLAGLIRKYADPPADGSRPDLAGVLDWAARASRELGELDTSDEAIAALVRTRDEAAERAAGYAAINRRERIAAADRLAAAVSVELAGLAMADATLEVAVTPRPALAGGAVLLIGDDAVPSGAGADGCDDVEFRLRPRPDSPALPLQKGASGGELSRVMLALEVVLAGTDGVPVLVFDEVDAGVGGRAAVEVGRRLARLARRHQVIVVTHLAQVAAFADHHLVVRAAGEEVGEPEYRPGVAASDLRRVDGADRLVELARMLAGRDTETARDHAAELLADAAAERMP